MTPDASPRLEWPAWTAKHAWLVSVLVEAENVATIVGAAAVTTSHLLAAAARLGGVFREELEALGVDIDAVRDRVLVTGAVNVGIRFEIEGVLPTFDEPPTQVAGETTTALEQGRRLAEEPSRLRPVHLLIAMREHHADATGVLSWQGLGTGRLRRYAGLPHTATVLAEGLPRDTPSAVGHGPLILLGGGTHGIAPVLSCLTDLGVPPDGRAAFVHAAARHPGRRWLRPVRSGFADSDLELADAGLARRPDAFDDAVLDRLRAADVIIVPGGHTERLFDALWGTPALEVLAERSDAGVPIVGSSAGAIVWGRAVLTNWETEDEDVPLPLLRWLPDTLIEAHWIPDRSEKLVLALREVHPDNDVLGPSHPGGVLVRDGHVTDLYPHCPSYVWRAGADAPEQIPGEGTPLSR